MDDKEREKMEKYADRREQNYQIQMLSEKYAEADYKAVLSYERRQGFEEGKLLAGIEAYKNMLARGYSKEEALAVSEIPEEVAEKIEMQDYS